MHLLALFLFSVTLKDKYTICSHFKSDLASVDILRPHT